jgi:hypothetical protein
LTSWRTICFSKTIDFFFLSSTQEPKSGPGRPIVEVSRSHTIRHKDTHTVGLLWTRDRPIAETATYTTHNKHNRRASMSSPRFEHAIPANKRFQTAPPSGSAQNNQTELNLLFLIIIIIIIIIINQYKCGQLEPFQNHSDST